jgi:hypothetical protein
LRDLPGRLPFVNTGEGFGLGAAWIGQPDKGFHAKITAVRELEVSQRGYKIENRKQRRIATSPARHAFPRIEQDAFQGCGNSALALLKK